jgi:predicted dehydrogenase
MSEQKCRWGIMGAAQIARKNWQAIRNSGNGLVTAVASRDAARAKQFIVECSSEAPVEAPPAACGSYEDLLTREDVDAVYIPLPTGMRRDWVVRAANAGKHVLCEKPCGSVAGEVREMIDACAANGVQFMDGVMYMHSTRMPQLREVLDDGASVGEIKRIATQFSFRAPDEFLKDNIRVSSELEPLGCLGDLGWYTIRMILWVMNYQMPRQVTAKLLSEFGRGDSPQPVPMEISAELLFDGGVSATMYNSFLTEHQQWVNVSGSRGHVVVSDFILPNYGAELSFDVYNPEFSVVGCQFDMIPHRRKVTVSEYSNNRPGAQETNLFRSFADLALSGTPDSHWPEIALKTQQVMDAVITSAREGGRGVVPE